MFGSLRGPPLRLPVEASRLPVEASRLPVGASRLLLRPPRACVGPKSTPVHSRFEKLASCEPASYGPQASLSTLSTL
jgi:hypothetical protein